MRVGLIIFALCLCNAVTPAVFGDERPSFISSSEGTLVWSFMGIHLLQTFGSIKSGEPYTGPWSSIQFQSSKHLTVTVKQIVSSHYDARRVASLVQSAYDTVGNIAGPPPVSSIEVFLVPKAYSYSVNHRSWSLGGKHSVAYVIPEDVNGFMHSTVRTVSHELFHAWVGNRQSNQLENELGAATIENCAELRAFGFAMLPDKKSADPNEIKRLAGSSSVLRTSMQARYLSDLTLDRLFINGEVKSNEPQAKALELLCKKRAKRAIRP